VLADGIGSGVKDNILFIITSKIICTMMANGMPIEDCVETMESPFRFAQYGERFIPLLRLSGLQTTGKRR